MSRIDAAAVNIVQPDWSAPDSIHACATTRAGGVSRPPYDTFNLGDHVGDRPEDVAENRLRLRRTLALPSEPYWLRQVHGVRVVRAGGQPPGVEADGAWSATPDVVCAVLVADCLPVLITDDRATVVAAAHAGWRGLASGVLEQTVAALPVPPGRLLAWMGPAIGPDVFEVGDEVRARFLESDRDTENAFVPSPAGRWLADLYTLARLRLHRAGVRRIYGGGFCTLRDQRFYSYRRDGTTGRMAALIWRDPRRVG